MTGMNMQPTAGNAQKGGAMVQKFGSVLASVTSQSAGIEPVARESNSKIPLELIPDLFNATTIDQLEQALQAISGNEKIELPETPEEIGNTASLEEFSKLLSVNPDEMLEKLKELLQKAGLSSNEMDELTVTSNMWTIIQSIDEAGIRFFENLNNELQNPESRNEAIQLLAYLKTVELIAPKTDMVLTMEQKVDSFQTFLIGAAAQFEEKVAVMGKQDPLPFIQQKADFRIVLEANSSMSTNEESTRQKQAETQPNSASSAIANVTSLKAEFSVQQMESNPSNRSESLLREMQALMKRANFGQVGGTNRMLIKLYPEHLGQIRIELLETNGIMTARILASTALAKGMLDSQLHQLKHAFNQQNLQVERIDIAQSIQETNRSEREQSFNEQFKREQQSDENKQNKSSEEERSFEEYMIELEV